MSDVKFKIFNGDSYYTLFAKVTYKWLISRKWVTYADIMSDYLGLNSANELTCNVSKCDNYGELKKAFRDIRRIINDKLGSDCFEEYGNNRNKRFRYIGKDDDPLADIRNAKVVDNLKQYWKFCQDSAGFLPFSWLEYFFKDCQDLIEIKVKKQKGEQVISSSIDRILTNIDYLPMLYEAIINKQVLEIEYKPYEEVQETLIFHPHYLKEYNGRWHLFGHAEGHTPQNGYNISLDRIQSRPREKSRIEYMAAPPMFYEHFFKNIVGVSHIKNAVVENITIRAHTYYIYKLTDSKPIHNTQKVLRPFDEYEDGNYGEFLVQVEVNNEFIGRILQMGAGLEIISPYHVRDEFMKRIHELVNLYIK